MVAALICCLILSTSTQSYEERHQEFANTVWEDPRWAEYTKREVPKVTVEECTRKITGQFWLAFWEIVICDIENHERIKAYVLLHELAHAMDYTMPERCYAKHTFYPSTTDEEMEAAYEEIKECAHDEVFQEINNKLQNAYFYVEILPLFVTQSWPYQIYITHYGPYKDFTIYDIGYDPIDCEKVEC